MSSPTGSQRIGQDWTDGWNTVLGEIVDDAGLVDYRLLATPGSDVRRRFDRALAFVERSSPDSDPDLFTDRHQELAYWLNAYNLHVIAGVLARWPKIRSVWSGFPRGLRFFSLMRISCGGRRLSLHALEHDIVRHRYCDARVHAALNCASTGCPPLRAAAYTGADLDRQLDAATRRWVDDPEHVRVEGETGERSRVVLNRIFDWFRDDFLAHEAVLGVNDPNLLDFVNRYRGAPVDRTAEITFGRYDRSLNLSPRRS